ncbi:efflux RND transporter periplasmic adaptor subunit [Nibricoccus aquaticus]|uniref:efflux RND transporter periplasmic adaptor subunit n=1 Tax=Nibricoccus aquaticus TaxID=2576891 RepID=UPI0010FE9154|nr:HlyD family efflux transporter periplasmic adaptor subunit [Nibricoccus aquaticus]
MKPSDNSAPVILKSKASVKKRRVPWVYIAGGVLLVLIVIGLMPKPVSVETARVKTGMLRVTVDEEGRTRVKNRYVIAAPAAGHMRRIELKPGAKVEARGTLLTSLETSGADLLDARSLAQAEARVRAAEAARDQAVARRESAKATAELARTELDRVQSLFAQVSVSRQDLDAAVTRARTTAEEGRASEFGARIAEYELEQARALLMRGRPEAAGDTAQESLATLPVVSPVSGRVLRVFQESARTVVSGTPLLEVGDATDLEVIVEVLSRDGVAIDQGAKVFLEQWGGGEALEAKVRLVEPSAFTKISALGVEEQRVNVIADFVDAVEKRPTLGDAYRVEARIVVWEKDAVTQVAAGALFQRGGRWQVFVVENGRARLREVKTGRSNGVMTQIVEGLKTEEVVIVYPGDKIVEGVRVKAGDAVGR